MASRLAAIAVPFLSVTGRQDNHVVLGHGSNAMRLGWPLKDRLAVHRSIQNLDKHLLVIGRADHMTFAGEPIDKYRYSRDIDAKDDAAAWARIAASTSSFWRRFLVGAESADELAYQAEFRAHLQSGDHVEFGRSRVAPVDRVR